MLAQPLSFKLSVRPSIMSPCDFDLNKPMLAALIRCARSLIGRDSDVFDRMSTF